MSQRRYVSPFWRLFEIIVIGAFLSWLLLWALIYAASFTDANKLLSEVKCQEDAQLYHTGKTKRDCWFEAGKPGGRGVEQFQ